jgi:hypothetical protein
LLDPEQFPAVLQRFMAKFAKTVQSVVAIDGKVHALSRHRQLSAVGAVSDDRGEIVGKDAGQGRQIAGAVMHGPREFADGLLAFGH